MIINAAAARGAVVSRGRNLGRCCPPGGTPRTRTLCCPFWPTIQGKKVALGRDATATRARSDVFSQLPFGANETQSSGPPLDVKGLTKTRASVNWRRKPPFRRDEDIWTDPELKPKHWAQPRRIPGVRAALETFGLVHEHKYVMTRTSRVRCQNVPKKRAPKIHMVAPITMAAMPSDFAGGGDGG